MEEHPLESLSGYIGSGGLSENARGCHYRAGIGNMSTTQTMNATTLLLQQDR